MIKQFDLDQFLMVHRRLAISRDEQIYPSGEPFTYPAYKKTMRV